MWLIEVKTNFVLENQINIKKIGEQKWINVKIVDVPIADLLWRKNKGNMNKAKAIREIDKAMKLIRWNSDIEVNQRVDILNSLYTIKYELRKPRKK